MEVKQAVKKVIALAAGASIMGATLLGAVARDLGDYPAPFVDPVTNMWADSVIVVGEQAATSDVLGAIEIAASLQAAAVTEQVVPVDGGIVDPTVSDGVKIEKGSDEFNYNDDIEDIDDKLTSVDLPAVLPDGQFKDNEGDNKGTEDFTQELFFMNNTATLVFEENEDTEDVDTYLSFPKGVTIYEYVLEFDDYVEFYNGTTATTAEADWEGLVLEMQGNSYTITDAKVDDGTLTELEFLAGDTVRWLQQDQPLTVGEHTVMVVNVAENDEECLVDVDGETQLLSAGDTYEFGDLTVGVIDTVTLHTKDYDQDSCKISLGSEAVKLVDGDAVEINSESVDDSEVTFGFVSGRIDRLETITISYAPEDDLWLAPGEEWVDPVFGNWKIVFQGMSAKTEEITFNGGSTGSLEFVDIEGNEVEIPFIYDDDSGDDLAYLGDTKIDDIDGTLKNAAKTEAMNRTMVLYNNEVCVARSGEEVDDCEDLLILAVGADGETQVLRIDEIAIDADDADDQTVTLKSLTTGATTTEEWTYGSTPVTLDIGAVEVKMTFNTTDESIKFTQVDQLGYAKTKYEARLDLAHTDGGVVYTAVTLTEDDGAEDAITFNIGPYADGDDSDAVGLDAVEIDSVAAGVECSDGSDDKCAASDWGTLITYDDENQDMLVLVYPEEEAYANVFVAPVAASVMAGGADGDVTTDKVNAIGVGMSALDSDAEGMNKHMIVVGGPCVNTVAADLLGNPADCTAGFEDGKAKLALYDRSGKTALLVAGYSARDSLGAAYVLADYETYMDDLEGNTEVELVTASLTSIKVVSVS